MQNVSWRVAPGSIQICYLWVSLILFHSCMIQGSAQDVTRQKSEIFSLAFTRKKKKKIQDVIQDVVIGISPCFQLGWISLTPNCGSWGQANCAVSPATSFPTPCVLISPVPQTETTEGNSHHTASIRICVPHLPASLHSPVPSGICLLHYV